MKYDIPSWAKRKVNPAKDRCSEVREFYQNDRAEIQLPDLKALKVWARTHRWPTPWFGFTKAFIAKLFESDQTFSLALNESGVKIHVPIKQHTLTAKRLKELDAMYEAKEDMEALGRRPARWGTLVDELREIRRMVEAGVAVKVEGTQTVLDTWQSFYDWAHGRYHCLEDGYDSWIGDDDS